MSAGPSPVYVTGVARSGTSWVGQVLNSCPHTVFRFQPFFSYEFKGRVDEESTAEEYRSALAAMVASETAFLTQESKIASGAYPRFSKDASAYRLVLKENRYQYLVPSMVRKLPELSVLAMVRNPCAVLNSWRKNEKEFPPGSDLRKEWRHGMCKNAGPEDCFGYYRWKEAANQYLDLQDKYPNRFFLLRYESAVKSPETVFPQVFDFFGLEYGSQSKAFIEQSTTEHSEDYYAVYKDASVAEQWRSELPETIVKEIYEDLEGTRLAVFVDG
ncbi:MAG: sulfotransferase [Pseudomonadota bacterium]